ncbi:MAG: deoxyribonuclease IV [Candidatus Dasytiphilus stammeri]
MKYIGAHFSIAGGIDQAILRAFSIKATALSFFIKNKLKWFTTPFKTDSILKFKQIRKEYNFKSKQIIPHSGYLINLGHPIKERRDKSCLSFIEEINLCNQLGIKLLVFHPGSHLRQIDVSTCLKYIVESINMVLDKTNNVTVVIENMAGQGSNVCFIFEHIASIINKVEDKSRIGVCLDIGHAFAAGYQISLKEMYEDTIKSFNQLIGINYLRCIHLNDSKTSFNSRIDRHESLGQGNIGKNVFKWIMNDKRFEELPLIIETPNPLIWDKEIAWLTSLQKKNNK